MRELQLRHRDKLTDTREANSDSVTSLAKFRPVGQLLRDLSEFFWS